jgi:hypothetical protein
MSNSRAAGFPDTVTTNGNQGDADDAFAVGGERIERELLTQQEQQRGDHEHAGGVSNAPLQTGPPSIPIAIDCQWGDGGEMIGT